MPQLCTMQQLLYRLLESSLKLREHQAPRLCLLSHMQQLVVVLQHQLPHMEQVLMAMVQQVQQHLQQGKQRVQPREQLVAQ